MAKRNNNTMFIAILVLLVLIYISTKYIFNTAPESNFDLTVLTVDTTQIASISITQKMDTPIKLKKKKNDWFVSQGNKSKPADKGSISQIFNILSNLKINNIAATSKEKWKDFDLTDSLATEVQLFDNSDKLIKDFYLGKYTYKQNKRQMYGNNVSLLNYVRLSNKNETFIVNGFLPMAFNKNFDDFRNQTILSYSPDKINKISFHNTDSSFVLSKIDSSSNWIVNNTDTANPNKIQQYINDLSRLSNSNFNDDFKPLNKPLYSIDFTENKTNSINIKIYQKDSITYIVNSSQNPDAFFISKKDGFVNRLLKSVNDFKD